MSEIVDTALALLEKFAAAIRSADAAALDALLSPGFRFVSPRGTVHDRASRIAWLMNAAQQLSDFDYEVLVLQKAAADAVVVTASFTAETLSGAEPDQGVTSLVLARRADQWRIVHQHDSRPAGQARP